ncbi:MAG: hypothetical protein REI09_03680 [Candidatus Dactylopiibacterium sp.]|nr:hypothetical protein [Candidatus Dactylopiibacterium sp.]
MPPRPRNPIVPALARRSGGGAHGKSNGARRQAEARALRRALRQHREDAGFAQPITVR